MLKKLLGLSLLLSLFFSSCFKKDVCNEVSATVPAEELAALTSYVEAVNPRAVFDSRGFYYELITPGSSNKPGICSDIYVNYDGKTSESGSFIPTNMHERYFDLSTQIYGWRYAIPMIGMGGQMKLYLPPSLGKGNAKEINTYIPAERILVYDIKLIRYN